MATYTFVTSAAEETALGWADNAGIFGDGVTGVAWVDAKVHQAVADIVKAYNAELASRPNWAGD